MKFKKINDHTIECLVSKEDLDSYGITMADFLRDQEKVTEFVRRIMELSSEELDFNPTPGIVSMQVSPAAEDGLCIIFSNQPPNTGFDLLQYIRDMLMAREADSEEGWKEHALTGSPDSDAKDIWTGNAGNGASDGETDLRDVLSHIRTDRTKTAKVSKRQEYPESARVYGFESFSTLEQFCKMWNGAGTVRSQLYTAKEGAGYYLLIDRSRIAKMEYAGLCRMLSEYGVFVTDNPSKIDMLQEHGRCVIAKNAISVLHDL